MNRVKKIHELLEILAGSHDYKSTTKLATELSNNLQDVVKPRLVREYLKDIQNELGYSLDTKEGLGGGSRLSQEARESIARLTMLNLTPKEKNALNDAFEIAAKTATFLYKEDLVAAKNKLYSKYDMKEDDAEYYLGFEKKQQSEVILDLIHRIKQSILNRKKVRMESHYDIYGITKEAMDKLIPLFVVHDADESFVILCHRHQGKEKFLHQNVLNIKTWEETSIPFHKHSYKIKDFINQHTIKIKGTYDLEFTIADEKGHEIFDIWNYEFKDLETSDPKHKKIRFFERHHAFEFLLRIKPHIKNLKADQELIQKFNNLISQLR